MPILNREDAVEVESRIEGIFKASEDARAEAVRGLFVEVLDFDGAFGQVDIGAAASSVGLPASVERVAHSRGVHVVFLTMEAAASDRVRKAELATAARSVSEKLGGNLLLVVSNPSSSQLHLVFPSFEGVRPVLRRMVVERDLPRRTAIQQVSNIYWKRQDTGSIQRALDEAFDVEPVTREFFREYKRVFEEATQQVTGFGDDTEAKRRFVQTLFNRLMFVYFLSRKGWLTFKGDKDYLNALWHDYEAADGESKNFYIDRLRLLFFEGLNNPRSQDTTDEPEADGLIGHVPFLNGGLFEKTELDERVLFSSNETVTVVPDEAIKPILNDLFDRFNFTVMESTPFDVEIAVDPEMLGKVFENLVTGRHDSGAYYTPRPVVSFMCREALKGYLEGQDTGVALEAIARFVDQRDTSGISSVAAARKVAGVLEEVTVVDPACGSGAYLLGMMQELVELQTSLFNVGADPKGIYDLKLHIIERNLYGVDIDDFAVNIAMLRLWLSLAIEFEGDKPPPLPNLDFKVLCGDSLLGPDPSTGVMVQGALGYDADRVRALGELKAAYMRASEGTEKSRLRLEIEAAENAVREAMGEALGDAGVPEGVINWRVDFAEVFDRGGFDVAIANPPYIQLQGNAGLLGNQYKNCGFETFTRTGDIYQLFYERGCQALRTSNGLLAYITSNSWLRAEYGKATRRYFAERHCPLRLLELGKDVFEAAIVDSGVLILQTGGASSVFPGVDMDRMITKDIPPPENLWGRVRPNEANPWSILSPIEQSIMDKMLTVGTPLEDWDIAIYRGITTGLNDAFIIDNQTKEALIAQDPKSAEIIKPVVRGRDIQRFQVNWRGLWLIATFPALRLSIEDYPAVREHLLSFGKTRLEQSGKRLVNGTKARKKTGHAWYEMQDTCAYHEDFTKEKLLWIELVNDGRFAYDNSGLYGEATSFLLTGECIKYLCAVLNARLIRWFLGKVAPTSGMGTLRWKKTYVERLPIPKIAGPEQRPLIQMVDRILLAKRSNPNADTSRVEAAIEERVYQLYGLTPLEIAAVEERS